MKYTYVFNRIEEALPDVDPFVQKYPGFACEYAREVIKGRWPEAEQYIIKDEVVWESYKLFLSRLGLGLDTWEVEDW